MTRYNALVAWEAFDGKGYNGTGDSDGVTDAAFLQQVQAQIQRAKAGEPLASLALEKDIGVFFLKPKSVAAACLVSAYWLAKAARIALYTSRPKVAQEAIIFANKCIADFMKPKYKADKKRKHINGVLYRTEAWLRSNGFPNVAYTVAKLTPPKAAPVIIKKKIPRRLTAAEKRLALKRKIVFSGAHDIGWHHEMGSFGLYATPGGPNRQEFIDSAGQLMPPDPFGVPPALVPALVGAAMAPGLAAGIVAAPIAAVAGPTLLLSIKKNIKRLKKLKEQRQKLKEKKKSVRTRARKRVIEARIKRIDRTIKRLQTRLQKIETRLERRVARQKARGRTGTRAMRRLEKLQAKGKKKKKTGTKAKIARAKKAAARRRSRSKFSRSGQFQPSTEFDVEALSAEERYDVPGTGVEEASVEFDELEEDVGLDQDLMATTSATALDFAEEKPFYTQPLFIGASLAALTGIGIYVARQRQEAQA